MTLALWRSSASEILKELVSDKKYNIVKTLLFYDHGLKKIFSYSQTSFQTLHGEMTNEASATAFSFKIRNELFMMHFSQRIISSRS